MLSSELVAEPLQPVALESDLDESFIIPQPHTTVDFKPAPEKVNHKRKTLLIILKRSISQFSLHNMIVEKKVRKPKKSRQVDKSNKLMIDIEWAKPAPVPPKKRGPKIGLTKECYISNSSWNSNVGKFARSGPGEREGSVSQLSF